MPYPMKIQPIDFNPPIERQPKTEAAVKPILRLKFRWLFEKPFSGVLRTSAQPAPAPAPAPEPLPENCSKDGAEALEPSSICLAKMVQNFIEGTNEKQRCGRTTCNCSNGSCSDASIEAPKSYNACEVLKILVPCLSISERNLLEDTAKIVEKNKINKRKDDFCRKFVADGLIALGYKASICRSKWDQTPSFLAGEYEYVDVIIEGERLIIDIDFRSEFEIARPTKAYRQALQTLPTIFVGKADRLERIVTVISEASKQSLKKKGLSLPPWRKAGYVKAKWLSPFTRPNSSLNSSRDDEKIDEIDDFVFVFSDGKYYPFEGDDGVNKALGKKWEPLGIRPKNLKRGVKLVTGLASIIEDKP